MHVIARERMGYEALRPGQQEALHAVLDGNDTLAVMPTGSGKSAIYQITAYLLPGPTVVVSPLLALQRDQLDSLQDQDVGEAVVVNSTINAAQREKALSGIVDGDVEFLFLAPEQFNSPDLLKRIKKAKPSLFVIDEAHCISEWGHDFRPDYLKLGTIIELLGHPTVLALTATASPRIRAEIVERLGMRRPKVIVQGFDRPNIWLGVTRVADEVEKQQRLIQEVIESPKPGIVYTATRRHAEDVAEMLVQAGVKARFYHAGMRSRDREEVQWAFMDDGIEVIVATIAFGMGVDKPNVRFVIHYDVSSSIDSYYQEFGRAGRDGNEARALLLYHPDDLQIHRFFASGSRLESEQVEMVLRRILAAGGKVVPAEVIDEATISDGRLATIVARLVDAGALQVFANGEVAPVDGEIDPCQAADRAVTVQEHRREFDLARVEFIQGYAEETNCRRMHVLQYFGEEPEGPCDNCDNCQSGLPETLDVRDMPFPVNSRVHRKGWGEGIVLKYENGKIVLLFRKVGRKSLPLDMVMRRSLLTAVAET